MHSASLVRTNDCNLLEIEIPEHADVSLNPLFPRNFLDAEALSDGVHFQAWVFRNDEQAMEKRCRVWLSAEELAREARFHRIGDRLSYAVTRGRLRELLGMTLDRNPKRLTFTQNTFGKPSLDSPLAQSVPPFFNVSRTKGYSIIALSWRSEIGVDIENTAPREHTEVVAGHLFHHREREYLKGLHPEERDQAFTKLWVRKEALAKAIGIGLNMNFAAHNLTHIDESIPYPETGGNKNAPQNSWTIRDLSAPQGYCAAVAWAEIRQRR